MSEQVDIAVGLGAVPPPLPDICFFEDFAANPPVAPPQIIEGFLHQGCKMILGGTSKSNKSWCLLDLALSVASGQPWWSRKCTKLPVVYINFGLPVTMLTIQAIVDWPLYGRSSGFFALPTTCW